jgi:thioredoxin-related protein
MKRFPRRIELIANFCVIAAALLLIFTVVRFALRQRSSQPPPKAAIAKGAQLHVPGLNWSATQTLVLVLSTECKYCTASALFYRRLVNQAAGSATTKIVAVLPQSPEEAKQYLDQLNLRIDYTYQVSASSLGIRGTPTLILVDGKGVVIESWEGQLPPFAEREVVAYVK